VNPGEDDNPETQIPPSDGTPPPIAPPGRIQWSLFFRAASPLAVVTGVATYLFFPVGLLLVLPLSLKRIIARYRPFHSGAMQPSQGALMGAFMAFLSFASFLVFFLATLSVKREPLFKLFHDLAAQSPDPWTQQMLLWYTTSDGFIALTVWALIFCLALFLIAGAVSGALITRAKKRPMAP
jgi:hypothetical protein